MTKEEIVQALESGLGRVASLVEQRLTARQREIDALKKDAQRIHSALSKLLAEQGSDVEVVVNVTKQEPFTLDAPVRPVRQPSAPRTTRASTVGSVPADGITRPQQRVLDTIAQFEALGVDRPTRGNVAVFLGVSSTTGGFKNNLSALRTAGYIDYPSEGVIALTESGRAIASAADAPQSLAEIHTRWLDRVTNPQARVLQLVLDAYPRQVSREVLASALDVSHTTGGFKNNLSALRSLGLIDYPGDGMVVATKLMFPEGLR